LLRIQVGSTVEMDDSLRIPVVAEAN